MEEQNAGSDKEINKDLLIEQYKLYVQLKDKFTERNFLTNKFFLSLVIVLFVLLTIFNSESYFYFINNRTIFSLIGMFICFLWWSNIDTYSILIKVKIRNVIEQMEKHLPFEVHMMEKNALDEYRKQKKAFLFSDMQKILATLIFIFFMVIFIVNEASLYVSNFLN